MSLGPPGGNGTIKWICIPATGCATAGNALTVIVYARGKTARFTPPSHFDVRFGSKAGIAARPRHVPLYPRKRTLELSSEMSALYQKQTYAVQQTTPLFDTPPLPFRLLFARWIYRRW